MRTTAKLNTATCAALAVSHWLALGLSLGWYYTFTYYGRAGWPMPMPEPVGALLLYYFSVLNIRTEGQAVHWLASFACAGALWPLLVWRVGRVLGHCAVSLPRLSVACASCSLPLWLPAPWMTWVAGQTDHGFSVARMFAVALRRGNVQPWAWLSPMYFALGLASLLALLAVHGFFYRLPPLAALRHLGVAAVAYVLLSALLGAVLGLPLRLALE